MSSLLLYSILRTIVGYLLLLIMTRFMGRKSISQMTFFDFAVGITIGTVTGSLALSSTYTPVSAGAIVVTLAVMTVIIEWLHLKSFRLRKLVGSEPVVLVQEGTIKNENMQKVHFSLDELMMQLRKKNIFNIADVEYALLETDGKLSVLPKADKKPVTPGDLHLSTRPEGLTSNLVVDGMVMEENLQARGLNEDWLVYNLKNIGIDDVKEVFYAGLDTTGKLYVSRYEKEDIEEPGKYGID